MKYLLDSATCLQLLNGGNAGVRQRFFSHQPADLVVCSIVRAELMFAADPRAGGGPGQLQRLQLFLEPLRSLPFDDACAAHYSQLRAALLAQGTPIGAHAMQLAAIALTHRLTLVSPNARDFSRIKGLKLDTWETLL